MYVYKITNSLNGMLYIGITTCSLEKRWREHKCAVRSGLDTPLYNAMRKHGFDAFKMSLVYEGVSREEIEAVEKGLIAQHGTYIRSGGGYNLTLGGEGQGKIVRKIGEESHNAVLTEEIVGFIRSPEFWDKSNRELVDMLEEAFGRQINVDTLKSARQGKTWKHLNNAHSPVIVKKGSRQPAWSEERLKNAKNFLSSIRPQAIEVARNLTKGKRGKNAKLSEDAVKDIFYSELSLNKTAQKHGISKKMALLIKQRKAHVYLTKDL